MNIIKLALALLIICAVPVSLYAEMYIWTDENGIQHFGDAPPAEDISPDNVEEVETSEPVYHGTPQKLYHYEKCVREGSCLGRSDESHPELFIHIELDHYHGVLRCLRDDPSLINTYQCHVTPLLDSAAFGRKEISKLLIEQGADVNAKHELYGTTPLHHAIAKGSTSTIELLLENGADVNAVTSRSNKYVCTRPAPGSTPLHWAVVYMSPKEYPCHEATLEIIRILAKNGAKPFIEDVFGYTPLDLADARGDRDLIVNIFKELGLTPSD